MNDPRQTVPAAPSLRQSTVVPSPVSQVRPSIQNTVATTTAPAAQPPARPKEFIDESIALIEDGEDATTLHKKIKAFGVESNVKKHDWRRQPVATGKGPVRVKTFHAKLSDQGLEFLDDAINHFLDEHLEADVKLVTSNIGLFDGKFKDLALIVNVWY